MIQNLWFALWFFLPVGLANVTPIFAAQLPILNKYDAPIDLKHSIHGKRIFGDHKTWRGLISGVIIGVLTMLIQMYIFNHNAWIRSIAGPADYANSSIIIL